jgi:hypothetical protein
MKRILHVDLPMRLVESLQRLRSINRPGSRDKKILNLMLANLFAHILMGHVRWDPCPHSMARPRVADGGTASRYGG